MGQVEGHVDWLTWTMKPAREPENVQELYHIARRALRGLSHEHEQILYNGQGFDRSARIGNFNLCLARDDGGVRFGGGGPTGYILFEITGRGCDAIREPELSRRFVGEIAELLTRFDYAVDIRADTLPGDFVNARSHQGFRSLSYIRSDKGTTAYVGSPKSDRFGRVYRYNPPHPRADLLRVEYVFRRALARAAATQYCQQESDADFHEKLAQTWGFNHPVYDTGVDSDERISVPSVSQHDEDTIAWLYKQVAPAVRRVLAAGGFDMAHWLEMIYQQGDG